MTWLPIESAPKDGTAIFVWPVFATYGHEGEGPLPYPARWDVKYGVWREAAGEQYETFEPTHWAPLDAIPNPPPTRD